MDKLSKTVQRAAGLDKMELDSEEVGAKIVGYFNEAHRCYLYGFNVACAVLCRAIIESSLAQVCDPLQHIKNSLERGESYFMNLIKAATSKGLLKDDRPGWADNIRKAGGYAIHDLDAFMEKSPLDKKSWNDRVPDLLLNTRKVLLDLYRDQTTV